MKQFIKNLIYFTSFLLIFSELIIRIFYLVPDIPERYIDDNGIQRYKQGQSGYYTNRKAKWEVNTHGWIGVSGTEKDTIISIIGDSFIENIMNPIECNQGFFLKQLSPNYSFFEAGRSGVTFIEAMEISEILESEVNSQFQILYLNENDFHESISEIHRYSDRFQISVDKNLLLKSQLKASFTKKILYNFKFLYFMYLKFPLFVALQNREDIVKGDKQIDQFDKLKLEKLFTYCRANYNLDNKFFVFHPDTDYRIIAMANTYGIKTLLLDSKGDKYWSLGKHDRHWSCYGHSRVSKQVSKFISEIL
ncbi:hypothetical protein N8216_01965 [Flavobacteriaceae bacterium]|nr:hypothetical protein [Flavobacteriaceae bacterium]